MPKTAAMWCNMWSRIAVAATLAASVASQEMCDAKLCLEPIGEPLSKLHKLLHMQCRRTDTQHNTWTNT